MGLPEGFGELVHHHASVLTIGDLGHQGGHRCGAEGEAIQPQCLIAGLHLTHELGVGALGLDQSCDRNLLTASITGHQAIGQQALLPAQGGTAEGFHAVLLNQQPLIPALPESGNEAEQGVGMVGQMHFRWREAAHPLQRLITEHRRKLMLPGADLQLQVRDRRGGGHCMAPEAAEKLHMALHLRIAGQESERTGDVVTSHLGHTPEQVAGVIEHDPRRAALTDQLGNQLGHSPVAMGKRLGVVVIPLAGVVEHVLQVGDQCSIGPGRDRGLMHVQRTGKGGAARRQRSL